MALMPSEENALHNISAEQAREVLLRLDEWATSEVREAIGIVMHDLGLPTENLPGPRRRAHILRSVLRLRPRSQEEGVVVAPWNDGQPTAVACERHDCPKPAVRWGLCQEHYANARGQLRRRTWEPDEKDSS